MALLRFAALVALVVVAGLGGRAPAAAQEAVDLQLVLAVDISWSMDSEEQELQREGYVAAFRDTTIQSAIISGALRRIAVTYVEWAGQGVHRVVIPWRIIASSADADRFANELAATPISRARMTSISSALKFSADQLASSGLTSMRRVIDVSGDGPNNSGAAVTHVRDELVADGVVINGLPILLRPTASSIFDVADLQSYYEACVIGGPGAFAIPIRERSEFTTATRQKLLLEIAGRPPELIPAQFHPPGPDVDCLIGEKLWQRYMDR